MNPMRLCAIALALAGCAAGAEELIIGRAQMQPGIRIVFEGAIKDEITPPDLHLAEAQHRCAPGGPGQLG